MGRLARDARKHNALDIEYQISKRGCWEVTSHALDSNGYPAAFINGKTKRLHRYSYEVHFGPIPSNLCVCHKCDNKRCINPKHFFLGTKAENTKDMKDKGRARRGAEHFRTKLNECEVKNIRSLYSEGISETFLAEFFGVSYSVIYHIVRGKTWAWL
jgi:hypothetical protein